MYSILYVDDDEVLLGVNKIYLEKTGGFQVDVVTSAREALDRIPSAGYDLILSDYQMPGMDGIDFLKEVRSRHGNLPFILFTGKGREEVVMQALDNGVDFYVQKGTDLKGMIAELTHKINRAIERRRTVTELNRSRQQMTDIINFLPDATFVINTYGKVIAWNHAMELMTGVRKDDIITKGEYEYAIPFTGERKAMLIDTVIHDPPSIGSACPVLGNPDIMRSSELFSPIIYGGRGAHLWVRAGPLCGPDGTVTGAIETIRDMTEFRKIKNDLNHSREMNLAFANILPVGVYEIDLNGTLRFANDLCFGMFGLTRNSAENPLCILDYITPSERERAISEIRDAAQNLRSGGHEYQLLREDGSTFPGIIYGAPVVDPDTGKTIGLRGVIIDQTQRKQEAQALHESEERLKLALQAGDIGIWDVDMRTLVISDIHEWAATVMGYAFDLHAITVNNCQSLVHVLDLPKIFYAFYQHLNGKAPYFEKEFRMKHHDGKWIWVAVRGKIIERDADGQPLRLTGTINRLSNPPGTIIDFTRGELL